jgi:hypothetical protein
MLPDIPAESWCDLDAAAEAEAHSAGLNRRTSRGGKGIMSFDRSL